MTITYEGDNCTVHTDDPRATILDASVAHKIPHFRECGGRGRCTTCRVRILDGIEGVSERTAREARIADARGWDPYTRLACQTQVRGDVRVQRLIRTSADISLLQIEPLQSESGKEIPVAILVCDIRQFTPFVDAHLPFDVFHILNRFFGELGEPILLNGGFIYQYVGDQVIGLFGLGGAPAAQSCLNAVRAGLGMIRALDELNTQIKDEFGVELSIRIGAHYGPLIIGSLGHPTRRTFSVVGDAINVASRIEGANEALGTTFLASEALFAHLPDHVDEGRRAEVMLKGKQEPFTLVEVTGFQGPDPESTIQATARRLLSQGDRFAQTFYRRLFEAAPETKALFSGSLDAQGQMLVQVLQMAVYGLSRFHDLMPGLITLGKNHVQYGVRAAHYRVFRRVFLDTVRELLGAAYDQDAETAWGTAIDRILDAMRRGAQSHRRTDLEGVAPTLACEPVV